MHREVLPAVRLIELPLPFTLGSINVYLVRLEEGFLLIDCGMENDACFGALSGALEDLHLGWKDIRQILLTHIHPDHMGLAPALLRLTGARLLVHADDLKLLNEVRSRESFDAWAAAVLRESGVPSEISVRIPGAMSEIQKSFHELHPDRILSGGEQLETAAGTLEVLWTPGHSPGHICLYGAERRVLFAGDQMLEHISPNIGWQRGRDSLGEFLESIEVLDRLDIDLILPSHGSPFRGHREWIRRTAEHHRERCDRILFLIREQPRSAHELVGGLWDRPLSPFHYRFALFEVLAHLEHLKRGGEVCSFSRDAVLRWQPRSACDGLH